jgi:hypothetical protein
MSKQKKIQLKKKKKKLNQFFRKQKSGRKWYYLVGVGKNLKNQLNQEKK